jgi:SAM-dependent methyltransferase
MTDTVTTDNGYGWTSAVPNQISLLCCTWIRAFPRVLPAILDIGSGFGVATIPMLEAGARVTALDLEETHLEVIRQEAVRRGLDDRLTIVAGAFPGYQSFEGLDAIHCSNVLHFLSGAEIEIGAEKMRKWLKPGGKVFIQVGTIYAGHVSKLLPLFEQRRSIGTIWAGETRSARSFVSPDYSDAIPTFMNFLDDVSVTGAFKTAGFEIVQSWYYTRHGLPEALHSDGRENFGLIASSPKNVTGTTRSRP